MLRVGGYYAMLFFMYSGSHVSVETADFGATRVFGDEFHAAFPYELYLNPKAGSRHLSEYREKRHARETDSNIDQIVYVFSRIGNSIILVL